MDYITDDVIRATNKSKLWTAIARSIFELEKRSKAQNVWNWTGYQKFVSVSHTDQQILASTQSQIALSYFCVYRGPQTRSTSHKHYFVGTKLAMFSCANYVSRTYDVLDDVTRSQSGSNFKIAMSPIFQQERGSKAQNIANAHRNAHGIKHRFNLTTDSIWHGQIVPNYASKVFSHHKWRQRVASKLTSISMFRRGWLREQAARAISRQ